MRTTFHTLCSVLALVLLAHCSTPVEYEDTWLDSPDVRDPSLTDPRYRVSTRPGLTAADRSRPVIIAAHGYTASTYEWEEFRAYAEANADVLVSLVLLGGHGRSVEAFQESTWEAWGRPILDEYEALVAQGYTNISLAGSSTGGALILEQLSRDVYDGTVRPRHFFFIDAIVVPGDKFLTLISVVGPIIGNVQAEPTEAERPHWYTNRPAETLDQLYDLLKRVRAELHDGIRLPEGAGATIYKTAQDETADPVSALYMYRGLREADGDRVGVQLFDSDLHVFTRLKGRDASAYGPEDVARQQAVFQEMIEAVGGR